MRRTKIVCTIGPSTSSPEMITRLIAAGMDVARLNFSHGTHEEHAQRIRLLREAALRADRPLGILQDLQGETALYRAQRLAMGRIKALIHAT